MLPEFIINPKGAIFLEMMVYFKQKFKAIFLTFKPVCF